MVGKESLMPKYQMIAEKVMENTPIVSGATTAAGTVSGVLTVVQGWVGIAVALGTFGLNWWYKRKKDKREQEHHENGSAED